MKLLGRDLANNRLLYRLVGNQDEAATTALFLTLYRQSPKLRHWLREDYARDEKVRAKIDLITKNKSSARISRFEQLTGDDGSFRKERQRLKAQMPANIYGGLKLNQLLKLIYQYQSGEIDPGVVLFARQWREAGQATPSLMWAGLAFLESILPSGKRRMLRHLNAALAFIKEFENKKNRRLAIGHTEWWKLTVLHYILRHPQACYRTRDIRDHLKKQHLEVGTLDIRRFCKRHGIKRDMLAGRPRARAAAKNVR
jgi:hypothetical protein